MAKRNDERPPGLYLRGRSWNLDFMWRGERYQRKIGPVSEEDARDYIRAYRTDLTRGELRLNPKLSEDVRFEDAVKQFLAAPNGWRAGTVRAYSKRTNALRLIVQGRRLSEITPWLIEKYKKARSVTVTDGAINDELKVLSFVVKYALDHKLFEGERVRPAYIPKPKDAEDGPVRVLEGDEETRLFDALRPKYQPIFTLGLHTGVRIANEGQTLTWADVDLERGFITIRGEISKSGKTRRIPYQFGPAARP